MQLECHQSRWIFGRRFLPRLEIGNEQRCRETLEDAEIVIKWEDNYGGGKYLGRILGSALKIFLRIAAEEKVAWSRGKAVEQ